MTVALKPVTRDDLDALLALKVTADQTSFVAPNEITLAQVAYEPGAEVFSIWVDTVIVGLLAWIDMRDAIREPGDNANSGYVWRLLIGDAHQGKGHGRAAMLAMHEIARAKGLPVLTIHAVPTNAAALGLYTSLGYRRTGKIEDGEAELLLEL